MKALETKRRAQRRLAARELGVPAGQDRLTAGETGLTGQETQALRLPLIPPGYSLLNADGELLFMLEFDPLDGGAPLG